MSDKEKSAPGAATPATAKQKNIFEKSIAGNCRKVKK